MNEETVKKCNSCAPKGVTYSLQNGRPQVMVGEDFLKEDFGGQSWLEQAKALTGMMNQGAFGPEYMPGGSALQSSADLGIVPSAGVTLKDKRMPFGNTVSPELITGHPAPAETTQIKNTRQNSQLINTSALLFGDILGSTQPKEGAIRNFTLAQTSAGEVLPPVFLQEDKGRGEKRGGDLPAPVPPIRHDERKSRFPYGPGQGRKDLDKPIVLPDPSPQEPGSGLSPFKIEAGQQGPSLPTEKGKRSDFVEPDPDRPPGERLKKPYRDLAKPHQDAVSKATKEGKQVRDLYLGTTEDCRARQFAWIASGFELDMLYKDYAILITEDEKDKVNDVLSMACDAVWASVLQHRGLYTPPAPIKPERGTLAADEIEKQLQDAIAKQFTDTKLVPTAVDQAWQQHISYFLTESGLSCRTPCKRAIETQYLGMELRVADMYFDTVQSMTEFPPYYDKGQQIPEVSEAEKATIELDKQKAPEGWAICSLRYKLHVTYEWIGYVVCVK